MKRLPVIQNSSFTVLRPGLKINSKIFVLEATIGKQREVADLFNCNIGDLTSEVSGSNVG
jgi:hypothetical protein